MANTKLTDTQRVVLAAAAARDSGLVLPLPASLGNNQGTHAIILKSLVTRGLLVERPAQGGETVWRDDPELGKTTLIITAAGMAAIGVSAENDPPKNGETDRDPGIVGGTNAIPPANIQGDHASAANLALPRAGSKLASLIGLLRRPAGATIPDIMEATSWQAHSIRGAISGALKKKLGLTIVSEATKDRGRVYRIGQPGTAEAGASSSSPIPDEDGPVPGTVAGEAA